MISYSTVTLDLLYQESLFLKKNIYIYLTYPWNYALQLYYLFYLLACILLLQQPLLPLCLFLQIFLSQCMKLVFKFSLISGYLTTFFNTIFFFSVFARLDGSIPNIFWSFLNIAVGDLDFKMISIIINTQFHEALKSRKYTDYPRDHFQLLVETLMSK